MGVKHIMKTLVDPIGSLIGYDDSPFFGRKDEEQKEEMSPEEKERRRRNDVRQGIRDSAFDQEHGLTWKDDSSAGYKSGGRVSRKAKGCGCASRGTRPAKIR
jgi:hypothetical protein